MWRNQAAHKSALIPKASQSGPPMRMAAILIGGPLCDALGMRALLCAAWFLHISGVLVIIFAPSYGVLELATFVVGLGNGLVEGVINPLVATAYPEVKTQKL